MKSGVQRLSSSKDTGISGWINQNSNLIIDTILFEHPAVSFLKEEGYPTNKSTFTRSEMISFFEDPTTINPEFFRRTRNRISTDKLLAEIIRLDLPKIKLNLKHRKDNKVTTVSVQFTTQSIKTIDKIVSSSNFKDKLQLSDGWDLDDNQRTSVTMAHLVRASICNILNRLNSIKDNPHIYERATLLQSSENVLEKIYQEKYRESLS